MSLVAINTVKRNAWNTLPPSPSDTSRPGLYVRHENPEEGTDPFIVGCERFHVLNKGERLPVDAQADPSREDQEPRVALDGFRLPAGHPDRPPSIRREEVWGL